MKLLLKLYGAHVLYVVIASQLVGFVLYTHILFVEYKKLGEILIELEILKIFIATLLFTPFMITKVTLGIYWLIPLLYFFKKTNTYLIWIFGAESIAILVIVIFIVSGGGYSYNKELSYVLQDIAIIFIILTLAFYKYKHIKRILANG